MNKLKNAAKSLWRRSGIAEHQKLKRIRRLDVLVGGRLLAEGSRVVEVGCSTGEDYIRFASSKGVQVTGVDIRSVDLPYPGASFMQANATALPYHDQSFDVALSIGVLEHIQPIENLARAISEIARVAKAFVVVVPAISTSLEPHVGQLYYPIRRHDRKRVPRYALNFMSDEAWLQFSGFRDAQRSRFYYLPLLITNTIIWRPALGGDVEHSR